MKSRCIGTQPAVSTPPGLHDPGVHVYAWDGENRLIAVVPASPADGDKMLEFKYDYLGRRVEKTYSTYGGQGEAWEQEWTKRYVYDEWGQKELRPLFLSFSIRRSGQIRDTEL